MYKRIHPRYRLPCSVASRISTGRPAARPAATLASSRRDDDAGAADPAIGRTALPPLTLVLPVPVPAPDATEAAAALLRADMSGRAPISPATVDDDGRREGTCVMP